NPEEPTFFARRFAPIVRWLPIGFGIAASFALVGLWSGGRARLLPLFPIWGFVGVYGATVVAFLVSSRYRLPVVPMLLTLSARGALGILDAARAARWKPFAAAVGGAALAYAASASVPVDRNVAQANGLCWLAAAEWKAGHAQEARSLYEQAIA